MSINLLVKLQLKELSSGRFLENTNENPNSNFDQELEQVQNHNLHIEKILMTCSINSQHAIIWSH